MGFDSLFGNTVLWTFENGLLRIILCRLFFIGWDFDWRFFWLKLDTELVYIIFDTFENLDYFLFGFSPCKLSVGFYYIGFIVIFICEFVVSILCTFDLCFLSNRLGLKFILLLFRYLWSFIIKMALKERKFYLIYLLVPSLFYYSIASIWIDFLFRFLTFFRLPSTRENLDFILPWKNYFGDFFFLDLFLLALEDREDEKLD